MAAQIGVSSLLFLIVPRYGQVVRRRLTYQSLIFPAAKRRYVCCTEFHGKVRQRHCDGEKCLR
jgi:hypothetical protein